MKKKRIPRKLVFILLYLVILPIAAIVITVSTIYTTNKPSLFTITDEAGKEYTPNVINSNKLNSFELELICTEYNEPTINAEGVASKTAMKFKAKAHSKKDGVAISNLTYKVKLASYWVGLESNESTSATLIIVAKDSTDYKSVTISNYNLVYPAKKLLVFKYNSPNAYVLLQWTETNNAGKVENKKVIVKYTYEQYFTETTKGGITK